MNSPFPKSFPVAITTLLVAFVMALGSDIQAQGVSASYCVTRALSRDVYNEGGSEHAVWLPNIATDLIFFPHPGSFVEQANGMASLTGIVRRDSDLRDGFVVNVILSGYTATPPSGSPKKDLDSDAYIDRGGPVNSATWHYYTNFSGTLTGFGKYAGAVLVLQRTGPAFQVGVGANNKNINFGASAWFNWYVTQQATAVSLPVTGQGDFNVDLITCQPSAIGDVVWLDTNGNGLQDASEPGVTNVEVRLTDCTSKLPTLDVTYTDANGFYYFNNLLPSTYKVQVIAPTGMNPTTANVGSNDSVDSDFSGGFSPCVTLARNQTNYTIDAGLLMAITGASTQCVTRAPVNLNYLSDGGSGSAVWMPKISTNLIFFPDPGTFIEYTNGTATLMGAIHSVTNLDSGFYLSVTFSGHTTTPPPGSPMKELDDKAYIDEGGPVDPGTWRYYTGFSGTLVGFGLYAGSVLEIVRYGPAFQIGVGASGKNINFGAGGWFTWTVLQQPAAGSFPSTGRGDFNFDLGACDCPACDLLYPFSSSNPLTKVTFNENKSIKASSTNYLNAADTIKMWYNDKYALPLGIRQVVTKTSGGTTISNFLISPLTISPSHVNHPSVGSPDARDTYGRPIFPALFITELSSNTPPLSGDWQFGGTAHPPHAIFGSWKAAVQTIDKTKSPPAIKIVPDPDPAMNNWNLDGGAAPPGLENRGYGTELRWNVSELGLVPGRMYRVQFMVHDGDTGETDGDAGQACAILCITGCPPPEIICPADIDIDCLQDFPAPNVSAVTVVSNGQPTTVRWLGDVAMTNLFTQTITFTRTYQASNQCGLAECMQRIILRVPMPSCPVGVTIECGGPLIIIDPPANSCPEPIAATILSTVTNTTGLQCPIRYTVVQTLVLSNMFGMTETCMVTNVFVDTLPPMITCMPSITNECGGPDNSIPPFAYDDCDGTNVTVTLLSTVQTNNGPTCLNGYRVIRTWQATDTCGNAAVCSQTNYFRDTIAPVLTCEFNLTVECGTTWAFVPPTGLDNCVGTNVTIVPVSTVTNPACGNTFTAVRIWRGYDSCSNFTTITQTVAVVDRTPPVITCATNLLLECGSPVAFTTPSAFDICDGTNVVVTNYLTMRLAGCATNVFTMIRSWRATDRCGNSSTCEQIITVVDTTPPTLTCATNQTVECGTAWNFTPPTAYDICQGTRLEVVSYLTVTNRTGACGTNAFTATRYWSATDFCGNSNMCSQTITVRDTLPPLITCATNQVVECGTTWAFTPPKAFDLCDGSNVVITVVSTVTNTPVMCPTNLVVTRTWRATDQCTNSSTCSQTITVVDTTPPVLSCGSNTVIECGLPLIFTQPAAVDNCDGTNVMLIVVGTVTNPMVMCPTNLMVTRTWRAIDRCGNTNTCSQTIAVRDSLAPAIVCGADEFVECGTAWRFSTPSAYDICNGTNVVIRILSTTTNRAVSCPTNLVATRTWSATDQCGNSNVCSQTFTLRDTTAPIVTCGSNLVIECGAPWSFVPPSAFDNCDGTNVIITIMSTMTNAGVCPTNMVITRTWKVADQCTNMVTCSQIITIRDTTPPVVTCASNLVVECGSAWTFSAPSAYDICDGTNVIITIMGTMTNAGVCPTNMVITRTWRVADQCTNIAMCSQTITIRDTTPPVVTCASNLLVECGAAWSFIAPSAFDICDGTNLTITVLSTVTNTTVGCPTNRVITRIWRVLDRCGNSNGCTQVITILDTTAPVITCATNQTIQCGVPWTFTRPTAFDICDGTNVLVTNYLTTTNRTGACSTNVFAATRFWSATDRCGNSNTCSQTMYVVDTIPPIIACVATQIVECGTMWGFTPPSAYDLCDGVVPVTAIATMTNTTGLTCPTRLTVTRVWRAADLCNNFITCTQRVMVVDTTPPEILCGPMRTIGCDEALVFDTPLAFDLCDGTLTPTNTSTVTNLLMPPGSGYIVTKTWQAADFCTNIAMCSQSITVTSCPPDIVVQMEVGCLLPGHALGSLGPWASGGKVGTNVPAFCYRVVVSNRSDITLTNCTVIDDRLGDLTLSFFPTPLTQFPPHASITKLFKADWPVNITNIVEVAGRSVTDGGEARGSARTFVTINPASIRCEAIAYAADDQDGLIDPFVTLPEDGQPHAVAFFLIVHNTGDADLTNVRIVTPGLNSLQCGDPAPFSLPAHSSRTNTLCMASLTCTEAGVSLNPVITAEIDNSNGVCSYDINGNPMPTMTVTACPMQVRACVPVGSCRVTGGGRQETTFPVVAYTTHGGQVGAPVGMSGFDPDSDCIQGNWEVVRHESGGIRGNFHTKSFDSLMCACITCADSNGRGGLVGDLCNPNDTDCGPGPRRAPANKIAFSGVGDFTLSKGTRRPRAVLFRVDIEDRGEPGNNGKNKNAPPDRHRIRIWILTETEQARLENAADRLLDMRLAISATEGNTVLQDGAIGSNGSALPNGAQVFEIRPPDIDDGGEMDTGNHQIHPMIKSCF